jgi:hypothetical protein
MLNRLESSTAGRAVISALIVVVVASVAISSLSDSPLKRSLLRHDQAILDVTGLDQRWNLFAPNPRRRTIELRARIRLADGGVERWTLPRGAPVVGVYSDHRWRKWLDNGAAAGDRSPLWRWLAQWLVATRRADGQRPVGVTIVGRWRDLRPPGADGPSRGPPHRLLLYRYRPL